VPEASGPATDGPVALPRFIDVSLPIGNPSIPAYPGDPEVRVSPALRIERGDPGNVSALAMGTHSGTHVDPPAHLIPGGVTVDNLPLDAMVGKALVVEPEALGSLPPGVERVLLRTAGSETRLSVTQAQQFVERGVRLVGIDALSVEPEENPGHPVHHVLLEAGVVILESLNLSEAPPGSYTLLCLPLRIEGGDGAPARAVLIAD
jgi:arylformamidase